MRVLLVEDEQPLVGYIEAGLRKHGFTVDVALDGRSALDKCEITPYDVVVLDRDLPLVHGDAPGAAQRAGPSAGAVCRRGGPGSGPAQRRAGRAADAQGVRCAGAVARRRG